MESLDKKMENMPFEEVTLQENKKFESKMSYEKDPLMFGNDIKVEKPDFTCEICDQVFMTQYELNGHKELHFNKQLICQICNQSFLTTAELINHKENHFKQVNDQNEEPKIYQCQLCKKIFKNSGNYHAHVKRHTSNYKEHVCDICESAFSTTRNLKQHIATKHMGHKMFCCKICNMEFVSQAGVRRHLDIHTKEKTHICHICGQAFLKKEYLVDHIYSHTGEKRFECDVCYKKFTHRNGLRIHKFLHDPNYTHICEKCGEKYQSRKKSEENQCSRCLKPYTCEICNRVFGHRGSFQRHIKIHTGTVEYTCKICNQGFIQKVAYNFHMMRHEKKGDVVLPKRKRKADQKKQEDAAENNYYCQICDIKLTNEDETRHHYELHSEYQYEDLSNTNQSFLIENYSYANSNYSCSHCQKIFGSEKKLMEHLEDIKKAEQIIKYQESIKKFKNSKNRTMRFKCEVCNFRFTENEMLEKHMLSHTGENGSTKNLETQKLLSEICVDQPLVCKTCNETFINKLSLEKHIENHTNLSLAAEVIRNNEDEFIEQLVKVVQKEGYPCQQCRKKFLNQLSLDNHIKVHEKESKIPKKPKKYWGYHYTNGISAESFIKQNRKSYGNRKIKYVQCPEIVVDSKNEKDASKVSVSSKSLKLNKLKERHTPKTKKQQNNIARNKILSPKSSTFERNKVKTGTKDKIESSKSLKLVKNSKSGVKHHKLVLCRTPDNKFIFMSPSVAKSPTKHKTKNHNSGKSKTAPESAKNKLKIPSLRFRKVDVPKNVIITGEKCSGRVKDAGLDKLKKKYVLNRRDFFQKPMEKDQTYTPKEKEVLEKFAKIVKKNEENDIPRKGAKINNLTSKEHLMCSVRLEKLPINVRRKSVETVLQNFENNSKSTSKIVENKKSCSEHTKPHVLCSVNLERLVNKDTANRYSNPNVVETKILHSEKQKFLAETDKNAENKLLVPKLEENLDYSAIEDDFSALENAENLESLLEVAEMEHLLMDSAEKLSPSFAEIHETLGMQTEVDLLCSDVKVQNSGLENAEINESLLEVAEMEHELMKSMDKFIPSSTKNQKTGEYLLCSDAETHNLSLENAEIDESLLRVAESEHLLMKSAENLVTNYAEVQKTLKQEPNQNSWHESAEKSNLTVSNTKIGAPPNNNSKKTIFMYNGVPVQIFFCMADDPNAVGQKKLSLIYVPIQDHIDQNLTHIAKKPNEFSTPIINSPQLDLLPKINSVFSLGEFPEQENLPNSGFSSQNSSLVISPTLNTCRKFDQIEIKNENSQQKVKNPINIEPKGSVSRRLVKICPKGGFKNLDYNLSNMGVNFPKTRKTKKIIKIVSKNSGKISNKKPNSSDTKRKKKLNLNETKQVEKPYLNDTKQVKKPNLGDTEQVKKPNLGDTKQVKKPKVPIRGKKPKLSVQSQIHLVPNTISPKNNLKIITSQNIQSQVHNLPQKQVNMTSNVRIQKFDDSFIENVEILDKIVEKINARSEMEGLYRPKHFDGSEINPRLEELAKNLNSSDFIRKRSPKDGVVRGAKGFEKSEM